MIVKRIILWGCYALFGNLFMLKIVFPLFYRYLFQLIQKSLVLASLILD